jgi:two-component system, chemotaxis family, chemotaxis protein CheY
METPAMKKMIWLVDDDGEVRHAVCMMFSLMGYDSRDFKDARSAAQALLGGELPNMMFLDINMPDVTGLDLLQFIRQRPSWQNVPVLMISSESQDTRVEQAIRMGADGYVFKPVSFDDLEMAIKSAFQRRKAVTGELKTPDQS